MKYSYPDGWRIKADKKDEAGCVDLTGSMPSHNPDVFWMQQSILVISIDKSQVKKLIPIMETFLKECKNGDKNIL